MEIGIRFWEKKRKNGTRLEEAGHFHLERIIPLFKLLNTMKTNLLLPVCGLALVSFSDAASVTILNPSFEDNPFGGGLASTTTPDHWTKLGVGSSGHVANGWNGGAVDVSNTDGSQLAWFNTDVGNGFSQELSSVYEVGMSYTLTVGAVKASPSWTGSNDANVLTIDLYYGAFNIIASGSMSALSLEDSQGALTDIVASLAPVEAGDAWADQPVGIRILSSSEPVTSPGNHDWAVDDVRLDAVPEPSTSMLFSVLVLSGIAKRRRA
jgi:hypothetical protein